ncbi:protein-cysteine S-palmitoyltransferase [Aureococcus anophagefferens]|uniref:Palmitoyltransferase n=1 Tax=Aureococcus anophagefferens TaxID=44056 RepID=A0ABR1G6X0_AURAN
MASTPHHTVKGTVVSAAGPPPGGGSSPALHPGAASSSCFAAPGAGAPAPAASAASLFAAVKQNAPRHLVEELLGELAAAHGDRAACASRDDGGHTLAHWAWRRRRHLGVAPRRGPRRAERRRRGHAAAPLGLHRGPPRLRAAPRRPRRGRRRSDRQGCTRSSSPAQWGQADAAAYLVKVGADVRIFDRHDDSALHWASYKGNLEIVGLGRKFPTPKAHAAAPRGAPGQPRGLRVFARRAECGAAAARAEDRSGKAPADLARDKRHGHVLRFLEDRRPAFEQGLVAFAKSKLAPGACLAFFLGGSAPETMRWPWFAMVFNKVLAQALYVKLFLGAYASAPPPSTSRPRAAPAPPPGAAWACAVGAAVAFNTQLLAWAAFVLCWRGDPGTIDGATCRGALRRAYDAYFERLVDGTEAGKTASLCHSCHVVRPKRSKHCRAARKCVMAFDHYCPYVGNTVGLYNYRYFYAYCAFSRPRRSSGSFAVAYLRPAAATTASSRPWPGSPSSSALDWPWSRTTRSSSRRT